MNDKILFIDVETGGIDPDQHSLLSVGLVIWESFKIKNKQEFLIKHKNYHYTEEALSINNINIETHDSIATPADAAATNIIHFVTQEFPGKEKVTLAGHNVQFDVNFLKKFLLDHKIPFSDFFSHRIIDTSTILHYLYLAGKLKKKAVSSTDAFAMFNISIEHRHTALGDAIATASLFSKLIGILRPA